MPQSVFVRIRDIISVNSFGKTVQRMTLLTLELEPELYEHLRQEAADRGETIESAAYALLIEGLNRIENFATSNGGIDPVSAVLDAAGLLTKLSSEEKKRAAQVNMTLKEVINALDASDGPPLSELIIEMRGQKD
jgi:hypothetical protein